MAACVSVAGASAASAQQTSAAPLPEPAREATPAVDPWTFSSDAGLMLIFIKPDKTADFETILARVKDALAKSDKAERRQQAAGWKIFKARETGPGAVAIYVSVMDPVAKDTDYSIGSLLTEAAGAVNAPGADLRTSIYSKYLEAFGNPAINLFHLTAIADSAR
ncbi:MAG TPA: hypothetical protein VGY57_03500 [Vicinamibacterales bacterium]|nr:hypothetical protein [Vicinamibacterales bacterium]